MNTYTFQDNDLLLDTLPAERSYVLRIRDLSAEDKPREKLIKHGPSVLSTAELLAVLLNTGTRKEGVLEMAARTIKEYGEKSLINQVNVEQMAKDLNIPTMKAAQIVACSELGRRFYKRNSLGPAVIRTSKDVYNYLRDMQNLSKEHLRGIYLNTHHRVIHDEVISIGTINSNLVHPREVFKPAVEYGAVAVILAHNHPSGTTKPSQADIEITRQLVTAGKILGINLLDHVIITRNKFASIEVDYH